MELKDYIRNVSDFPKPGIQFKDITTLWKDARAFKQSVDLLFNRYRDRGIRKVVGAESRGFIVASPLAYLLNAGFVPVRKRGKLPAEQVEETYALEYGTDALTMHEDAIQRGEKVLIVDDLLATGGTVKAMINLVKKLGGDLEEVAFLVELEFLHGREGIDVPVFSIVKYGEE
ncbi:MAG: adenine phosphoribosyltransferase [Spirochaetes bacterium DG_61]|jgi:adenine phosphoribosyltransferase|nr:MAG: adenine phosphoribosyltransferase [Spirochaetes bacterium DG_61]